MSKAKTNEYKIFTLCCLALLCAMQIVLARFAVIPVGDMMRFSMSFIPVVIAARRFGIVGSTAVYGLGDLLGAIVFPTGGAFFPGYTLTAAIAGAIYGIFLRPSKKEESKASLNIRIVLSAFCTQLFCSLLLNGYWRAFQTGTPYTAVLLTRLPQCAIMCVVQRVFMILFLQKICKAIKIPGVKL